MHLRQLGFKEVYFDNTPQDGAEQDTSRDLTLSRVFGADEFLGVSEKQILRKLIWLAFRQDLGILKNWSTMFF